jgi:hypothetical protein
MGRSRATESRAHVDSAIGFDKFSNLVLEVADAGGDTRGDISDSLALVLVITNCVAVLDAAL